MKQSFYTSIIVPLKECRRSELAFITTAFSIPLWPQLTIACTVIWFLIIFLDSSLQKIVSGFKSNPIFLLPVFFYAIILLGLVWTENYTSAFKECMDDLYLLLFPILINGFDYSYKLFHLVRRYFSLGGLLACVICLALGLFYFISTGDIHEMFYIKFSKLLHPTYFGATLILSLLFLFDQFKKKDGAKCYWVISIQILTLILLCSKITYLMAIAVLLMRLAIALVRREKFLELNFKNTILVIGTALVFGLTQYTQSRIPQLITALEKTSVSTVPENAFVDSTTYNSSTIRIAQIKYSVELIRKNSFYGSGTGDVADDFRGILEEHHDTYGILHFRLPHNFYLHILIMLGYPGILVGILLLLIPIIWSLKKKYFLFMETLVFFSITGMTDIIIHATLGTLFAFAFCFLYAECRKNEFEKPYKEFSS